MYSENNKANMIKTPTVITTGVLKDSDTFPKVQYETTSCKTNVVIKITATTNIL